MRIQMTITVDVDRDAWNDEYKCGSGRDEIRADVVRYVDTVLDDLLGDEGVSGIASAVRSVTVCSKGKESK